MKKSLVLLAVFLTLRGFCQSNADSLLIKGAYAGEKYSFSISESLYGSFAHYHPFGVFEINFCDRLDLPGISRNASLSANGGVAFQPFQGTRLHVGANYELLSKRLKFNMDIGTQYMLGLAQATTMVDGSNIYVGYHNYLVPYVGLIYWPTKGDPVEHARKATKSIFVSNPKFWRLFYFKLQFSYAFLISSLHIDSSGGFDPKTYGYIVRNTENTFAFKFIVGINIPSFKKQEELHQYLTK